MARKKSKASELPPYWFNPDISVFYELEFGKSVINPGDSIKIKNSRGTFRFIKLVHNAKTNVTWIDCMDSFTGEFKSFYVDRLKNIVINKRSRKKDE